MKKIISFLLVFILATTIIPSFAAAEPITIDPETASYEEIVEAITLLNTERIQRLKAQFAAEPPEPSSDGITFRGVPFLALKPEAEEELGAASYYQEGISYPKAPNMAYSEPIGKRAWYRGWTVAGYDIDRAEVSYVYPVVDGALIRDDDYAIFYEAYYIIEASDEQGAARDLEEKLTRLYGACSYTDRGEPIWTDKTGNSVYIYNSQFLAIVYRSYKAFDLADAAHQAYLNEQAQIEAEERIMNQNNTDGL